MPDRDLYLVAYDVACPRRLRAALELVRGHATGGQYSAHECWLTPHERDQLLHDAALVLDESVDRLLMLRLDPRASAIVLGAADRPIPAVSTSIEFAVMTTLVLDRADLELRTDGAAMALYDAGERRGSVPLALLERVVVVGSGVRLDSGVLARLGECGVALLVVGSRGGRRLSLALGPRHNDASVRIAQCLAAADGAQSLAYARALVGAKVAAQRRALARWMAARPDARKPLFDADRALEPITADITAAADVASLRGLEGAAAAAYFRGMGAVFPPALGFSGRNRRPPRDPVNAVLSLGYTLLHFDAVRAAHVAGLDPLVGFLHRPAFGRESLACDLIEPLRPRFDQWAWELFRSRALRAGDFSESPSGCQLLKAARGRFYPAYETAARGWRRWLRRECARLVQRLRAEGSACADEPAAEEDPWA